MEKPPTCHTGPVPPDRYLPPSDETYQLVSDDVSAGHPSPNTHSVGANRAAIPNRDPKGLGEIVRRGPAGGGGVKPTGGRFTKP